jgi:formylglycine-generating enzyme required for sulfatase activity
LSKRQNLGESRIGLFDRLEGTDADLLGFRIKRKPWRANKRVAYAFPSERALRGGSFANNVSILGTTYRLNDRPDDVFKLIGFRCAASFIGGK